MQFHNETALMFTSIGSLPASLFDNPAFINWTSAITRGAYYVPPSAAWLDPSQDPVVDVAFDAVMTAMKDLIQKGLEFYKGVGFLYLAFSIAGPRALGFRSLDLSMNAPSWLLHRENMHAPFVGEIRRLLTLPLAHLTGSHTGVRIALKIAALNVHHAYFSKRSVQPTGVQSRPDAGIHDHDTNTMRGARPGAIGQAPDLGTTWSAFNGLLDPQTTEDANWGDRKKRPPTKHSKNALDITELHGHESSAMASPMQKPRSA